MKLACLTLRAASRWPRISLWTAVFLFGTLCLFTVRPLFFAWAAISLSITTPISQNLDGLGTPTTTTTVSNLPTDWRADNPSAVRTVGNYATAGTTTPRAGGANLSTTAANGIYNFGAGTTALGGSDRAVGFLSSGTATQSGNLYAQLVNNTGGNLSGLQLSYNVEKYRNGSNAAGFRIQMFYSTDGATWTSAGNNFLSSFVANADNTGFATAPGTTSTVSNQTLSVTIPSGSNFYLAWNYSVASGTTTTNAQALAIDDISILGLGGGGATNPTGTGLATPGTVAAGGTTLLTVSVTPGTSPASTGLTVTADLTAIGGASTQAFSDDGTNGDVTAGDNIFSYQATVGSGTSPGAKSLPVTINDAQARTGSTTIALTISAPATPLAGTGSANPSTVNAGDATALSVTVTPATSPASTGITVVADLTAIGGTANQSFSGSGNTFTFNATVANGTTAGIKSLPVTITDAQARTASTNITLSVQTPTPATHVVISQIYGGGGNSGATFTNDYVELYNPTATTVSLTGWSLQYGSATGTAWTNKQPLGGLIGPGEYFLVSLASGGANGAPLPYAPNIAGDINMSGTAGKIALVNNGDALSGACPLGIDPDVVDFVGYGSTANCFEGSARAAAPSNTTALFRKSGGLTDTDQNGADFLTGVPNPRRTAPIQELGPWVASTEPITNGTNAPYDATITVDFSEAVTVDPGWYSITCSVSGVHTSATVASYNNSKGFQITPNESFTFGEQCTVTIFKDKVHDQDTDDGAPDTDGLFQNYSWTFTVVGAGAAAPYTPSVHLTLGNPSNAIPDQTEPNNYLMVKPTYTLSYNRDKGTPNWVSWHLETAWYGTLTRNDTFRADPRIPPTWYRVQSTDYFASGFDRGHLTPNADRDNENRIPINQETYLMTNMMPQSPDNNQGPWANFEAYLRTLTDAGQEVYVIAGPAGVGGSGSNGGTTNTIANGNITVPASTWKVVLILPKGDDDVTRTTCAAHTIAILMPNTQGIRNVDWTTYITTVDAIETLTGYDLFSSLPAAIQHCVEAGINGTNPPGTENQIATTTEDTTITLTLQAVRPNNNNLTFSVVGGGPTQGTLGSISAATCIDGSCSATVTYTPGLDYNGSDSFQFKVNNGTTDSNTATFSLSVTERNDVPVPTNDSKSTNQDTMLSFAASTLTGNDAAGPANEAGQALTVTSVTATANTNGTVTLNNGTITYTPAAFFSGPASFSYQVCDNGTSNGLPDSKCATATVNVTVVYVNSPPTITGATIIRQEGTAGSTSQIATVNDVDQLAQTLTVAVNGQPSATVSGVTVSSLSVNSAGQVSASVEAACNASNATFTVQVTDNYAVTRTANLNVTVQANTAPLVTITGPTSGAIYPVGTAITFTGTFSDAVGGTHTATWTFDTATQVGAVNETTGEITTTRTFTTPGVYLVTLAVSDGCNATGTANTVDGLTALVVIYDPTGGFVTGGGWITSPAGAYLPNPALTGKASFGFVSKYLPGANVPTGNTEFQFKAGNLSFSSTSYEWLVVAGARAQFKGVGTINGSGNYGFMLTAIDGQVNGGGGTDKFRLRIWDRSNGDGLVYDNQMNTPDNADPTTVLGGGSIVIHK